MMQILRRTTQILVLVIIILIPLVNYYGIKIQQKDDYGIKQSFVLSKIHKFFVGSDREEAIETSHKIKGSVWTMDIMGFRISDPLAVVESTTTALYFYPTMILSLLIPVLFTMIFGRVYCGWICPANLLFEINDKIRTLLQKTGYNARDIKFKSNTKYYILGVGLILAFFAGRPVLSLIYPPAVMSREIFYKIYNGIFGFGLTIMGIMFFVELILSRRWWCRYVCPGGAIYALLSKTSRLKIKLNKDNCDQCGDCIPICPYDLKPMTKELGADCDQCGLCISVCAPDALNYKFSLTNNISGNGKSGAGSDGNKETELSHESVSEIGS